MDYLSRTKIEGYRILIGDDYLSVAVKTYTKAHLIRAGLTRKNTISVYLRLYSISIHARILHHVQNSLNRSVLIKEIDIIIIIALNADSNILPKLSKRGSNWFTLTKYELSYFFSRPFKAVHSSVNDKPC